MNERKEEADETRIREMKGNRGEKKQTRPESDNGDGQIIKIKTEERRKSVGREMNGNRKEKKQTTVTDRESK